MKRCSACRSKMEFVGETRFDEVHWCPNCGTLLQIEVDTRKADEHVPKLMPAEPEPVFQYHTDTELAE